MDSKTIFTKTARGLGETVGKTKALSRGLRKVLKEVDGHAPFGELQARLDNMPEDKLQEALAKLLEGDYIREFRSSATEGLASDELDFGTEEAFPETLAQLTIGAYLKAVAEAPQNGDDSAAKAPAPQPERDQGPATVRARWHRDAARYNEETVERAKPPASIPAKEEANEHVRRMEEAARQAEMEIMQREAEMKARREAEAKARKEAEEKARIEAEERARQEAEKRARREAEEKARAEAEAKARREAEAKVKKEAEEKARIEAEAKARREAEEKARKEAEARARREAEEEARKRAEEKARLEAEEAARKEAEERARRQAVEKALRDAEARAKKEQERARREAEERERKEAEERAAREAQESAKRQAEEEARRRAEEQARIEAEEARLAAELKKEQEAREQALREEQGRREAELQKEREARELTRLEEERKRLEAEKAAKEAAEEKARLEAEDRERRRAEEKAKRDAEAFARKQAKEETRRKTEEEAKQAAQERANRKAEERARRKEEQEVQRAAKEQTRRDAQEQEREARQDKVRSASRKIYPKPGWGKTAATGLLILAAAGVASIPWISFDGQAALFEKTVSAQFHQPVKIGAVHFALWPRPHWRIEHVVIGDHAQIKTREVAVNEAFGDWFAENPVIESVEISSPVLNDESMGWILFGKPQAGRLHLGHVVASNAKWEPEKERLGVFDIDAQAGNDGGWKSLTLFSSDRQTQLELHPDGDAIRMELTAENFPMPFGAGFSLSDLHAVGVLHPDRLEVSEFRSSLYDGTVDGNAKLDWSSGWSFKGGMRAKDMSAATLAPAIFQGGSVQGDAKFALRADESGKLFNAPRVEGNFAVTGGTIAGIDLIDLFKDALKRGQSAFSELAGGFVYADGKTQLRGIRLKGGLVSAAGYADVGADNNLDGHFIVDLKSDVTQQHADLSVSGTLKAPRFAR